MVRHSISIRSELIFKFISSSKSRKSVRIKPISEAWKVLLNESTHLEAFEYSANIVKLFSTSKLNCERNRKILKKVLIEFFACEMKINEPDRS